ncbi:cytochrome P450 2A6-like [Macaca nemestrina]|uniref:cytochrome P450 2A6-like n=1 Tax=Macaca nemestrina TaxID=9545 RepID=UPI0039B87D73
MIWKLSLIRRIMEEKNPNTEFYLKNLVLTALNLFIAGTETVSTTLHYGVLLLTKHPEVEGGTQRPRGRVHSQRDVTKA